jgi:predicted ribosome quality control (RQC) complex YloA/Tae2 family protein
MGRHSNIILVDCRGKIIDAAKRVDFVTSEVRQVLPGMTFVLPPAQEKKSLLDCSPRELTSAILTGRDLPLWKAVLEQAQGLSPLVCREVSAFVCGSADLTPSALSPQQQERLEFYLGTVATALGEGCGAPTLVRDPAGKWVEFSYLDLRQYPEDYEVLHPEGYSALLDLFYQGKDSRERMRQKTAQLHKSLCTLRDRLSRKLGHQRQELLDTGDRQRYKEWGDIISANLYRMERGDRSLRAQNFFSGDGEEVEIPLDPTYTPAKNAQKYYGEYRKAATAEGKLRELIAKGEQELLYLESAIAELERAASEEELQGIREELISQGYLRRDQKQKQRSVKLAPLRYRSSDGFLILCGRNNLQNDQLTLREARNYDLWLHTQKIHGAHVIIVSDGAREIPERTIEEAAVIAACNSAAGTGAGGAAGAKVPVDYTFVKHVWKPNGGKPGMVLYDPYQTAVVAVDHRRAEALLER